MRNNNVGEEQFKCLFGSTYTSNIDKDKQIVTRVYIKYIICN